MDDTVLDLVHFRRLRDIEGWRVTAVLGNQEL